MNEHAQTIAVIPARWASTRLPGKCLIPLCGKPMILWVLEAVQQCKTIDRVMVATDEERIAAIVEAAGGCAVLTRSDHPSGTDRVAEAVRTTQADIILNVQGDEPLIEPALIDRLSITLRDHPEWDMATAATPINNPEDCTLSSVVKVVWGADHRALYFSRAPIPHVRDEEPNEPPVHWRHLGVYGYRRAFLEKLVDTPVCPLEHVEKLEQLRALHIGARIAVIETTDRGAGVDTSADVPRVEQLIRDQNPTMA